MVKNTLLRRVVGSTSRARFETVVQKIVKYGYARRGEIRLFSQADFLSVAERKSFYFLG